MAFHHSHSAGNELSPEVAVQIAEEMSESGRPLEDIIKSFPAELRLDQYTEALRALAPERSGERNGAAGQEAREEVSLTT